ncbi:MAG: class I SAM-dependent methyltransferase [Spirochaetes bacterium]|nr:MAG: class I SAM-dependent methyltransferase [Spirochaetota bacterium]
MFNQFRISRGKAGCRVQVLRITAGGAPIRTPARVIRRFPGPDKPDVRGDTMLFSIKTLRAGVLIVPFLCTLMTAQCSSRYLADHFNKSASDESSQAPRVIQNLSLKPGDSVADIGAGGGHFTLLLARAVGSDGRVWAVDINPDFLDFIKERATAEGIGNIGYVRASFTESGLAAKSADLAFLRNVFHDMGDRVAYFARLKGVLKPGGRVAIIDYLPAGVLARLHGHFIEEGEILAVMKDAGYIAVERHTFLEGQSFNIFKPVE